MRPRAGRAHSRRPRLRRDGAAASLRRILGRLAHARGARRHAVRRARSAAARRAHQLPRPRGHAVAGGLSRRLPAHRADRQPRSRAAQSLRRLDPASRAGQAHPLHRRLRPVRGGPPREAAPRPQAQEEAGRRAPPHRGVHHPLQGQGLQGPPGAEPHQGAGPHAADRRADRGAGRALPVRQPGQGVREPPDPARGRRRRLRGRPAGAAGPGSAPRCRRPRRPARRQRQRQEHLRQADRRAHGRRWPAGAMPPTRSWWAISPSTRWTTCLRPRRPTSTCST